MPVTRKRSEGDDAVVDYDISVHDADLNVTLERWALAEPQASVVLGRDVTVLGTMRPDRGRRPIGVAPVSDAICWAEESTFSGRASRVLMDRWRDPRPDWASADGEVSSAAYTVANNRITKVAGFGQYNSTRGRNGDRFVVHLPKERRGAYAIQTDDIDPDYIVVDTGWEEDVSGISGWIERQAGYASPTWDLADDDLTTRDDNTFLMKSPMEYEATGPWPSSAVGGLLTLNADNRVQESSWALVESRYSTVNANDTLILSAALVYANTLTSEDKFQLAYTQFYDKRGIWMGDGRRFWLLQNGVYYLYIDLGSDDLLGLRWSHHQISPNLIMFVNPSQPGRVLRLDASPLADGEVSGDETLCGMIPPVKPGTKNDPQTQDREWLMAIVAAGGSVPDGTYSVQVRAVNYTDFGESQFVSVYRDTDTEREETTITATGGGTDAIAVYNYPAESLSNQPLAGPPQHRRWTHMEVWRADDADGVYYLEAAIDLPRVGQGLGCEDVLDYAGNGAGVNATGGSHLVQKTPTNTTSGYPCILSAEELQGRTARTESDVLAGGLPPVCQKVASIQGITVCAGRATEDVSPGIAESRQHFMYTNSTQYTPSATENSSLLDWLTDDAGGVGQAYAFQKGDIVEIVEGGQLPAGSGPGAIAPGSRATVHAEMAGSNQVTLKGTYPLGEVSFSHARYCLVRQYDINYSTVQADHEVSYSRTDKFAPESFPARVLSMDARGDTFKNMVLVGNYAVVIMEQGVYLVFVSGSALDHEVISDVGDGTPWGDSVATLPNSVVWATSRGPRILTVNKEPNDVGQRGQLSYLDSAGRMDDWFREAAENGYDIDTGVDTANHCVRFRRKISDNEFQVAQYSYRYDRWTLLDDDNGVAYVRSVNATGEEGGLPRLYSVTKEGSVFLVNADGDEWPYTADQCSGQLSSLDKCGPGFMQSAGRFTPDMLGDVIRFYGPDGSDEARIIRSATVDRLEFDDVDGLCELSIYTVGATRFKIRFAPYIGPSRNELKILRGVSARIVPGDRENAGYPTIAIGVYEDFNDPVTEEPVQVFRDDQEEFTTSGRIVDLEAGGHALELGIENFAPRVDFRVQSLVATIIDRGTEQIDAAEDE